MSAFVPAVHFSIDPKGWVDHGSAGTISSFARCLPCGELWMDDYSGRLNALALLGAALLLTVVVIGLSGYDNHRVDVVKTVSISVPN